MQDEHLSFWSFPITFRVLHYTGNKAFTLNQDFIKDIWENQVIGFSTGAKHKISFLTSTNASNPHHLNAIDTK